MADDPESVSTNTSAVARSDLALQVQDSYAQDKSSISGVSGATIGLLKEFVDTYLQQEGAEFPPVSTDNSALVGAIGVELGLDASDNLIPLIQLEIEAFAAGKKIVNTTPATSNIARAADPVEMFSGQFLQDVTDLSIDGAGISLTFRRSYRNQAVYFGPLGANWDHSYNLYLREWGAYLIQSSGDMREDIYSKHPIFNYWVPPDGRHGIIEPNGSNFIWRSPGGVRFSYRQDPSSPNFYRIDKIEDRFGNYLGFTYSDEKLRRIEINHPARFAVFDYDDLDRIIALQDHTGRIWTYAYDDYDDLIAVTSPPTDRYPSGLTTSYEYSSSQFGPPLQHNLLSIIDCAGQLYLENDYGLDSGLLSFNRVIRQRQGSGESLFEYETVVDDFEFDYDDCEKPAVQVNQMMRNGQMVHLVYNKFGNLLMREEYLGQGPASQLARWLLRYNRDGALVALLSPEGVISQYYLGREDFLRVNQIMDEDVATNDNLTATTRLAFGNVLAIVRRGRAYDLAELDLSQGVWADFFPDVLESIDVNDAVTKITYESQFQRRATVSDPRFTTRADPRQPEAPDYFQHLTRYEYSAATLSRVRFPDTTFPAPLPDGTTGLSNVSEEYLQYDARGRLRRMQDPGGFVTEHEYFAGGTTDPRDGYLIKIVRDSAVLGLSIAYEVNDVGIRTRITDGRGNQTVFTVNELNQTIETIPPAPGGRTRLFFNENGLIERQERDNFDDQLQPSADGDEVRLYKYDEQNNLVAESMGGVDVTAHHIVRHKYDESDTRIETILPRGNRVRFDYDERSLLISITRGFRSPLASTMRARYDRDGRKTAMIDARGDETTLTYDVFNRVTSRTDALGHVTQWEYDKLNAVTLSRFFERRQDGTYLLLRRSSFEYNELGARTRWIQYLFSAPIPTTDIGTAPDREFDAADAQGLVTPIETQLFYDANQRLVRSVNGNSQATVYEYDGVGRRVVERDEDGNSIRTDYDENSNLVRTDWHEIVRDSATGQPVREDVFTVVHEHDALNRLAATTDGLGNRTAFGYDSRNNLASTTDPLGRASTNRYDVYGRRVKQALEITDTGLGGGTRLADVVTQYGYDPNDNLTWLLDRAGNKSQFTYDDLDRQRVTVNPDESQSSIDYDVDDNIIGERDANGLRRIYQVDAMGRQISLDLDYQDLDPRYPYPSTAETFERHEFDGLGRTVKHENDWCAVTYSMDSLGRSVAETTRFTLPLSAPTTDLVITRAFDAVSNCTGITYPSGRSMQYNYDNVNRLRSIRQLARGTYYPGSASFNPQYDLATYQYRGLRADQVSYANQTLRRTAYDGNARIIGLQHVDAIGNVLLIQQLFDGAGSQRVTIDQPPGAAASARVQKYDSMNRLTKYETTSWTPINPSSFQPPAVPLPTGAMTGQVAIDQSIGALAQNPADYTYRYDANDNRVEERDAGYPPASYVVNAVNEYSSVDGTVYAYDLNGNLLDDGSRRFLYNSRNQLSTVFDAATSSEVVHLMYDATGRLVSLREGGLVRCLIYDGDNTVEEYIGDTVTRQYVNEPGVDRQLQVATDGEEWWCHCDPQGSLRQLSDSAGYAPPASQFQYAPFGLITAGTSQVNPYLFQGKRRLATTIYDSRARQYIATLGRFLQRDPKGLGQGPNMYSFCSNNPGSYLDRFGLEKTPTESAPSPPPLTQAEQQAFDEAERAKYDADSVEKLISVYADPVAAREGVTQNSLERYATVRGTAFSVNLNQGNWGTASFHLGAGLFEAIGSSFHGRSTTETVGNGLVAALLGRLFGKLGGLARSRYVSLMNRPAYTSDIVIRPSPETPIDREGAYVWADILSQEWADTLTDNLSGKKTPATAGVSIDVTTGEIRYGSSGELRILPHPDAPLLPSSLVQGRFGPIPVNQCTEHALQDRVRWAGARIIDQIMSVRDLATGRDPATNSHAFKRACWNCQVTSNGAVFTAGVETPP